MTARKQGILLFCILMFCYTWVHQGLGWNQNSRLDLLRGLLLHKTFQIDADHENTGDKSIHDGHYYSDKAPGIVLLAAPAFAASLAILNLADVPLDWPKAWLFSSWMATVGSVGLITALGGVALFAFLCQWVGQRAAFVTSLVVFLGAGPFPYATMLFSHAAVTGLLCIALWAIADGTFVSRVLNESLCAVAPQEAPPGRERAFHLIGRWPGRYLLAGLCCGLAIASEYTAAPAAGGVLALSMLAGVKRSGVLALGALPPLLLIPFYNWVCFGGPLSFGYHFLALTEFQQMNKGLFGITFPPKASAAYLILFSPERGLFFWTPFFLMAFTRLRGFFSAYRKLFWVCSLVIVLHVICISGYYMPGGGAALGPRHLAPVLPFMALLAAFGLRRYPHLGYLLGSYSLMFTGIGTLISAMPGDNISNPLFTFYLPRLLEGQFTFNLGVSLGLPRHLSACVIFAVMIVPYLWGTFGGTGAAPEKEKSADGCLEPLGKQT